MENGWIKLHRKILNNPIAKKPTWAWLWITLLLLANHNEKNSFIWNGKKIEQKKGQFITGRKKLKEISGVPETTIERILDYLESEHQIGQQKTSKYRLITILNWNSYQKLDSKADNKRTTDGHNQEIQEDKEEDKGNETLPKKSSFNSLGTEIIKAFEEVDPKNKTYYGNKTQRASCDFLINEYGLDRVLKAIKILPQINQKKLYIKQITSPYDLKENWVKIGNAIKQDKSIITKNKPNYIL